jgi:hypothetical protein
MNRRLTSAERELVCWMLENGAPEAIGYLAQVDLLEVSPWKCQCGCASLQFEMKGRPAPTRGLRPLAEYVFGSKADCSGIFVYEQAAQLAGIEVYGLTGEAAKALPEIGEMKSWEDWGINA